MKVLVETSARHVHVTDEHLAVLFGEGYQLTKKKDLSQPGQFASNERVDIVGPKGVMPNVSILGPTRKASQVELSLTDARKIGIAAPVRESGDLEGTPGCVIKGPAGEVTLENGVIAAKRHIHFTPEDAEKFGVKDSQVVSVRIARLSPLKSKPPTEPPHSATLSSESAPATRRQCTSTPTNPTRQAARVMSRARSL